MPTAARTAHVEDLVKQLYGLGAVRRTLIGHAQAQLGSQGFLALGVISASGPLRVSDVAAYLAVDLSVASRQVRALAAAGYVVRAPDRDDGRAQVLVATDSGRRVVDAAHERMVQELEQVLARWSVADVRALTATLDRLRTD